MNQKPEGFNWEILEKKPVKKVIITKSYLDSYWYSDKIGHVFNVEYDLHNCSYIVKLPIIDEDDLKYMRTYPNGTLFSINCGDCNEFIPNHLIFQARKRMIRLEDP